MSKNMKTLKLKESITGDIDMDFGRTNYSKDDYVKGVADDSNDEVVNINENTLKDYILSEVKRLNKIEFLNERKKQIKKELNMLNEGTEDELDKLRNNLSHFYEYKKGSSKMLKGTEDSNRFWFPQNANMEARMDRHGLTRFDIEKSGNIFLGQNDNLFYFPSAGVVMINRDLSPNQILNVFNKKFNTQFKNFKIEF